MAIDQSNEKQLMTPDEDWKPCPPGTIDAIAKDQQRADDQQQITRRVVVSLVAVAGSSIAYALLQKQPPAANQLSCADVKSMAGDYIMGQLTPNQSAAVDAHLAHCKRCEAMLDNLRESGTV